MRPLYFWIADLYDTFPFGLILHIINFNLLGPLPVEVIPMARSYVARQLVKLGGQPVWRENVTTDNGNQILDVHGLRILDPPALETAINGIVGVVTCGLFAHRPADVVLIGSSSGVRKLG